jgi:DNA-binding GntR family transcriptional regulator
MIIPWYARHRHGPTAGTRARQTDLPASRRTQHIRGAPAAAGDQTQLSDLLGAFPLVEAQLKHSDQQHAEIVRAVQRGQAAAAGQQMEAHVDATANLIRGFLG